MQLEHTIRETETIVWDIVHESRTVYTSKSFTQGYLVVPCSGPTSTHGSQEQ